MKDPSSQQVLKYNEALNSCLNIIFAMLPKGKGVRVFHSLCSSVLQVNHTISMPKRTDDKPTALPSWKSKLLSQVKAADPGRLCSSVVTDTLMITPTGQAWGKRCISKHMYVRVSTPGLPTQPTPPSPTLTSLHVLLLLVRDLSQT